MNVTPAMARNELARRALPKSSPARARRRPKGDWFRNLSTADLKALAAQADAPTPTPAPAPAPAPARITRPALAAAEGEALASLVIRAAKDGRIVIDACGAPVLTHA